MVTGCRHWKERVSEIVGPHSRVDMEAMRSMGMVQLNFLDSYLDMFLFHAVLSGQWIQIAK